MKGKNRSYLNHKVSALVALLTLMGLVSAPGGGARTKPRTPHQGARAR
jgi:hypothetical protein